MSDLPMSTLDLPSDFNVNTLQFEIYPQDRSQPIELKIGLIGCFKPLNKTTTAPPVSTTPSFESMSSIYHVLIDFGVNSLIDLFIGQLLCYVNPYLIHSCTS